MKKQFIILTALTGLTLITQAQNVGVNTDGSDPDANTIVHIKNDATSSLDSALLRIENEKAASGTGIQIHNSGQTGTTAQWDIIVPGGSTDLRIKNSATDYITIQNDGDVGIGTTAPLSGLDVQTSMGLKVNTITSATTLDNTHNVILCNTGPYTVTLPDATLNTGRIYFIKNIDTDSDAITVDGDGAQTLDGETTYALSNYQQTIRIISDGSNWHILDEAFAVEGTITALTCGSSTDTGDLFDSEAAAGVSSEIPYTGGNGGPYSGEAVASTGVTGLTATLASGTFASGSGTVTYDITGTPASAGTASFDLTVGGQTCTLTWSVSAAIAGNATCTGATISATPCSAVPNTTINDDGTTADGTEFDWADAGTSGAANTTTTRALVDIGGQCWMRYNMNVTPSAFDPAPAWVNGTDVGWSGYYTGGPFTDEGLLYQWSAAMNNNTTERAQGVCPNGFHIPGDCEWMYVENALGMSTATQQRQGWSTEASVFSKIQSAGTNSSGLSFLLPGVRFAAGNFGVRNSGGYYWSSAHNGTNPRTIGISTTSLNRSYTSFDASFAFAIRCVAD